MQLDGKLQVERCELVVQVTTGSINIKTSRGRKCFYDMYLNFH